MDDSHGLIIEAKTVTQEVDENEVKPKREQIPKMQQGKFSVKLDKGINLVNWRLWVILWLLRRLFGEIIVGRAEEVSLRVESGRVSARKPDKMSLHSLFTLLILPPSLNPNIQQHYAFMRSPSLNFPKPKSQRWMSSPNRAWLGLQM